MTIKVQAFQANGMKTDYVIDEYEFCCWDALEKWLQGFGLHKCPECKNTYEKIEKEMYGEKNEKANMPRM